MHRTSFPTLALTAIASATLLVACGGGGNSDPTAVDNPTVVTPSTATLPITGIAAVGPLSGATACYDLNDNAACDSAEPSATTGADGRFSLAVGAAQVGRHATLVNVPATAVDAETATAVGTAFSLSAPATGKADAHSVAVTPLSTAVANFASLMNLSVAQAEAAVQASLGLSTSPLADYVAAGDAQAARLARVVQAMTSQAGALATTAALPADATQALLASVRSGHLALASALAGGSKSGTAVAVANEVAGQVLAERYLSADTVAAQARTALAVAGAQPAGTPGDFVSVRRFTYADAGNYNLFAFVGNSTPDADGRYWAHEARRNVAAGQALPFNRNTAYLDASGRWVTCDNAWQTVRSSAGSGNQPQESVYCAGQTSRTRLTEVDVSGRRLADVVAEMRAWPMRDSVGADTDDTGLPVKWGPDPATLGSATFPAGSVLTQRVQLTDVGGTQRFSFTDRPRVVPASGTGTFRQAATFGDFKRMAGNVVDATVVVNSNNTIFLEDLPATVTDPTLRAVKRYRVGFDPAGDAVRYYACDVIDATNVSRDCVALGDGTSRIDTVADSRMLRFTAGYPQALTLAHKRQRLFVERTGLVFGGHHEMERTVFQQRPNTVAWNALRTALALPETAAPAAPAAPAGVTSQLRSFTYADAGNYNARLFEADSALTDANGYYAVTERRQIRTAGQAVPFERNVLYWTGSDWYSCPNDGIAVLTVKASAPFDSVFCKTYADERGADVTLTLDGRLMSDVVREIRLYGSKDGNFDYAGWGPNPDVHTALASQVFPAGSTMTYRDTLRKTTPLAIAMGAANLVKVPQSNQPFNAWPFAPSLEAMTIAYSGEFRSGAPISTTNTLFVGNRVAAVAPGPEYTTLIEMRVAFDPATQSAHFFRNYRLRSNNAVTAFTRVLETRYSVQTVGDTRILAFDALPEGYEADFGYARYFAQRDALVLYAFKDAVPTTPMHSIRLNAVATQALFSVLGVQ